MFDILGGKIGIGMLIGIVIFLMATKVKVKFIYADCQMRKYKGKILKKSQNVHTDQIKVQTWSVP